MRILFFNFEYPLLPGGAGNSSASLLKEFSKISDMQIDVITSSPDNQYQLQKINENINIHQLAIGRNEKNPIEASEIQQITYMNEAYKFAVQLMKVNKYDLSHAFFNVPCGFVSLKLKRKFKLPYILSIQGNDVIQYNEAFSFLNQLVIPKIQDVYANADYIISSNDRVKDMAAKIAANHEIIIIKNGVDIIKFHPEIAPKDPRKFKIVCASYLDPENGVRFLIQASKALLEKYANLELVIIGEGKEKESLENLAIALGIRQRILFAGNITQEELVGYYKDSNVFVNPSLIDRISNNILEVIACGLPVITTDIIEVKGVVEDGENGFIIQIHDNHDLVEKIEKLIQDNQLANLMSAKSRLKAESLSWENFASQYFNLYELVRNAKQLRGE